MSLIGSRSARVRGRFGLLPLYFGFEWKAEQITSQARQPWHLSASILMVLTIFFFFSAFMAAVLRAGSCLLPAEPGRGTGPPPPSGSPAAGNPLLRNPDPGRAGSPGWG